MPELHSAKASFHQHSAVLSIDHNLETGAIWKGQMDLLKTLLLTEKKKIYFLIYILSLVINSKPMDDMGFTSWLTCSWIQRHVNHITANLGRALSGMLFMSCYSDTCYNFMLHFIMKHQSHTISPGILLEAEHDV